MTQVYNAAAVRIMDKLAGRPPQTISELMHQLQVTRTAITEQLNELMEQGMVVRTPEPRESRNSRGRPLFRYSLTQDAIAQLYPGIQRAAMLCIWRAIQEIGGDELRMKIADLGCEYMKKMYEDQVKGTTPTERFLEILTLTASDGEIRMLHNPDGSCDVWRRVCEVSGIDNEEFRYCSLHINFLKKVSGGEVLLIENRHTGSPCCRFRLLPE